MTTGETTFGRYRLLEPIGQGGTGQVYRALDTTTDRVVALKVLPPHASDDDAYQQRFRRDARIAASLSDPHVVPIHGYGDIDGRLYLDMRLIEGRTLADILKERGRLDPKTAVSYVEQVAEALNAAHSAELVHRDIKPSNILVTERDFVYVVDFGIACADDETQSDPGSDVYSLASVLYECLTGRPVSEATAELPAGFDAVLANGLAKEPADRYSTGLELASAARAALDAKGAPTKAVPVKSKETAAKPVSSSAPAKTAPKTRKPDGPVRRQARGVRWGRVAIVVALIVVALGLAGSVYSFIYRPDQQIDSSVSAAAKQGAEDGTVAVLSYSPDHLDADIARAKSHLTGDFLKYYTQFTDQIFAAAARQQQVTTSANVERAAVADLHPASAVVLLFVNKQTVSKANPVPAGKPATVRATMKRVDGAWLIEKFEPL
ncbi:MAG TPA: serine/threonine-protein kinase [Mycobacterium sp.]|nr:serine/threonine-protein kinase [Mycobacterium sp.]